MTKSIRGRAIYVVVTLLLLIAAGWFLWRDRSEKEEQIGRLREAQDNFCGSLASMLEVDAAFLRDHPEDDVPSNVIKIPPADWVQSAAKLCIGDHECTTTALGARSAPTALLGAAELEILAKAFRTRTPCVVPNGAPPL